MRIKLGVPLKIHEIVKSTNGVCNDELLDKTIDYISTDSKDAHRGDLFIALKGDRFNGEDFAFEAFERGCYILSTNKAYGAICVKSTAKALLSLANYYKSKLAKLKDTIGITGSVGKTTTKELLKFLCSQTYKVHANEGNKNNLYGVPLTILSSGEDTEILILEFGMNAPGEIKLLSECAEPSLGIITNVGTSHIGNLGTRESIAKAKSEILFGMNKGDYVIVPDEEPLLSCIDNKITYSLSRSDADFYMEITESKPEESQFNIRFFVKYVQNLKANIGGRHNLSNLACAISAAILVGVEETKIFKSLMEIKNTSVRYKLISCGGFNVYDDSYNASLESVVAAVAHIKSFGKPFSLVLGDILELGEKSNAIHYKIGLEAVKSNPKNLFLVGRYADILKKGALDSGYNANKIYVSCNIDDLRPIVKEIKSHCDKEEIILLKASNKINLSRICDLLKYEEE